MSTASPANPDSVAPPGAAAAAGAAAFYKALAGAYDGMVDFAARVRRAGALVELLRERFRPVGAGGLDLGCGTGAYACALARAGFATAALDLSEEMLGQARANAARLGLEVRFVAGALEALPPPFAPGTASLVLCLGNTLPHLLAPADLAHALEGVAAVLAPGGVAALQTLNYDRILARRERVVSVDRDAERTFFRFYDFRPDGLLQFNLLQVTWQGQAAVPAPLLSVLLRPYTSTDLFRAVEAAGLVPVCVAGDLALTPYDAATAETILLVLRHADRG